MYVPVLRVFEFPAQPVRVPTAPVVTNPKHRAMLIILALFFIILFSFGGRLPLFGNRPANC
jgi:hypothetical protein